MRIISAFIVCVAFALVEVQADPVVLLDSIAGKAEILKAGKQHWSSATKGMKLFNNDMIHVLEKSKARLQWPDGSSTFVSQNTQILINVLQ